MKLAIIVTIILNTMYITGADAASKICKINGVYTTQGCGLTYKEKQSRLTWAERDSTKREAAARLAKKAEMDRIVARAERITAIANRAIANRAPKNDYAICMDEVKRNVRIGYGNARFRLWTNNGRVARLITLHCG